jgi:membrane associated rhomboid family serine protease
MYDNPRRQIERFFRYNTIPVTVTLIGANVLTFLIAFFTMRAPLPGGGPFSWLVFSGETWPRYFWTLITWPLVSPLDLINLLFGCLWAYWVCGSLERSWGPRVFAAFLLATAALTAFTLWGGGRLLGAPSFAQGIWLATAAPTIAWCAINRREVIRLYGVIPIPAPILALLTVAFTWFSVSVTSGHPLMGLFALSGSVAAYWYVTQGRYTYQGYAPRGSGNFGTRRSSDTRSETSARFRDFDRERTGRGRAGFDPLRWWKDRKERKRLEEIFRRSGFSDDEKNR